jgi:hypothetical protein
MTWSKVISAVACVSLLASAAAASAETRVRIRNDSVHPANITVDKKSRDVRPRKAASFPIASNLATLKVAFANGDMNKGDFNVNETLPVENAPDGNTYYCMTLDEVDFELQTKAVCEEWVAKLAK